LVCKLNEYTNKKIIIALEEILTAEKEMNSEENQWATKALKK
jgi:hypothetical protein